jgi:signal transduction histidine kinase
VASATAWLLTVRVTSSKGRLRRRLSSVRVRVGLVATVAVCMTLLIGGVGLIALLRQDLVHSLRGQAQLEAAQVAALADSGALPNPLPAANVPNLTVVQVVDTTGRVIASSPSLSGRPPLIKSGPTRALQERTLEHPAFAPNQRFEAFSVPVTIGGQPVTVIVASSLADFEQSVHVLGNFLLIALPLLLVVMGGTSWVIIGRSLRPVEAMRAEVAEITTRQLNRRVPVPGSDDEVGRLAVTLNQMLDRLQASTDLQQRFVADASHELRSPVANIKAAVEVALRHPELTDWPAVARDILDQDERMADLVNELLLLARFDEGTATQRRSTVEVSEIVSHQAQQVRPSGAPVVVTAVESGSVLADRGHLERLVGNLVDNAARHAATVVEVSVTVAGDWVEVRVRDDGPGVPEADRGRIFERFVRLEEDRARASGGLGLGLAIVNELVALYGGTINVGDAQPGAVFIVRLPRYRPPEGPGEEPPDRPTVVPHTRTNATLP